MAVLALAALTFAAACDHQVCALAVSTLEESDATEPRFNPAANDTMVFQDSMDQYSTPHAMDHPTGCALRPYYPDQNPQNYAVIRPGHGTGGSALRLIYLRGGGERPIWKTDPEDRRWYQPANAAFVVQYWFRISKDGHRGGSPGYGNTAVGMKWIEFWRLKMSDRTQFGVTAGDSIRGPSWHVNPAGKGPLGYQPVGPYWNEVNDNQWHRATYLYQPASWTGATDGVARMWIDGVKIVDVSAGAAGVTPPGGTKPWCTAAEVGLLDTYPTGTINLGEYMNGSLADKSTDLPMTVDFDDFKWWRLPARIP